jgi:hypothetical protein
LKNSLRKRIIAIILIVSASIVNIYGWQTSKAPSVRMRIVEGGKFDIWNTMGLPSMNYTLAATYTFEGTLSVNNPIHVRVVLLNSNLTVDKAVQYYPYLGYTGSINADAVNEKSDVPFGSRLDWKMNATGAYVAENDLIWTTEGPSWSFFVPSGKVAVRYPDVEKGMPSITVTGLSDTLNVKNNEITQRLTWIAAGFSILLLQPILEALLLKDDAPQEVVVVKGTLSPQGLWREDRKGSKQTTDASSPSKSDSHDKIDGQSNRQA